MTNEKRAIVRPLNRAMLPPWRCMSTCPLTTDLMLSLRGEIDGRALESANLNLLADRCPIEGQSEYQKVFR